MSTWRELTYMVMDELKITSDDSFFNENHVAFLLEKYRALLLKQKYSDVKKTIPSSNYQDLCLQMEVETGLLCSSIHKDTSVLKSTEKVPFVLGISKPRVFTANPNMKDITFVNPDRFSYVGYNKYLQNIIYSTINNNGYLYLKSMNPQLSYLKQITISGVFESPSKAFESSQACKSDEDKACDYMDTEFPIEEDLIPPLIEMVVKELSGAKYQPEDKANNSNDDLSDMQLKSESNGRRRR